MRGSGVKGTGAGAAPEPLRGIGRFVTGAPARTAAEPALPPLFFWLAIADGEDLLGVRSAGRS